MRTIFWIRKLKGIREISILQKIRLIVCLKIHAKLKFFGQGEGALEGKMTIEE